MRLNYFQREIADFAYEQAQRKASGERTVVGVNKYVDEGESRKVETHQLDPSSEKRKIEPSRDREAHPGQSRPWRRRWGSW